MARYVFRRPYLARRVLAVSVLPHVRDRHRMRDVARTNLVSEQTPHHVVVDRQRVLREHGIAQLLELLEDLVVYAGIVVVRPPEYHHAQPLLALQLIED